VTGRTRQSAPTGPAAADRTRLTGRSGFTLLELLVALLLTGFFAIAMHQFCLSLLRGVRLLEVTSRLQEGARITLALMARDLREAGYGLPRDSGGVRSATWDGIRIARDLNGDGDTDDSNERLGYWFDGDGQRLLRQLGNAPAQPMLEELAPAGLAFVYYDAAGNRMPTLTPLPDDELARIRRIDLRLTLEAPHPDSGAAPRLSRTTTVALRNG